MPTVQQMIDLSDTLSKTQTRIFEYMLNHPEAVCYDTLRNTAERIGVTEVSVLKVCRKLGCSGYAEMKEVFQHYVGERLKDSFDRSYTLETVDDRSRSDRGALLRSMFEAEQQGITALAASIGEEQIFDCAQTLMNAREVLLFGHDVSKVMADYFAHRLNYLRIKASSLKLGDSDTVKTSLSMVNENDVIVLFSFPPYYEPVSNVARYAAYRGATIITITDSPRRYRWAVQFHLRHQDQVLLQLAHRADLADQRAHLLHRIGDGPGARSDPGRGAERIPLYERRNSRRK